MVQMFVKVDGMNSVAMEHVARKQGLEDPEHSE